MYATVEFALSPSNRNATYSNKQKGQFSELANWILWSNRFDVLLTNFTVGETQQKRTRRTLEQLLFGVPFADETVDQASFPRTTQVFTS